MAYLTEEEERLERERLAAQEAAANQQPTQPVQPVQSVQPETPQPQPVQPKEQPQIKEASPYGPYASADEKAQAMGLRRTIAEHSKGVEYEVVKYGDYTPREGMSPKVAQHIDEANKAGKIRHGQGMGTGIRNEIRVDYSSIQSPKQAAYFGLSVPPEEREKYAEQYADATGQTKSAVIAQFEAITGDRYFAVPKSDGGKVRAANKALGGVGLTNAAGEALDIWKATPQMVIQSLYMNPDSGVHEDAWKAIQVLQKTPGNAWYGMELTKSDLAFKDSADLTEDQYKTAVKTYNSAFSFSGESSEKNDKNYLRLYNDISKRYANKPKYVQDIMFAALDKSYSERNGDRLPPKEAAQKALAEMNAAGVVPPDGGEGSEDDSSFWGDVLNSAKEMFGVDFFKTGKKEKNRASEVVDKINEEAENAGKDALGGLITVGEDGKTVLHGTFGDEEIGTVTPSGTVQPSVPTPEVGHFMSVHDLPEPRYVASAFTSDVIPPSAYFSVPKKEEAPVSAAFNPANLPPELLEKYKKTGEVQGAPWIPPVIRNAVDVLANADRPSAEINEIVPYDPDMTDAKAMALYYSGRELDARNKAQIAEVTGDRQSMDMLDAIYNTNATRGGVAVSRYVKYGERIGRAMDSLSTGELDAESVNNGFFILNDVRRQINAMIENEGNIIVPYGVSQYDYILERQPALMEKVSFVEGMLDQFNDAKTLAKQEAAKEHQAITDQYMADMQEGHGTPDKAAWLALEDMGGKDPGMAWMEDPTYIAFLDDTLRNGRIFAGKALFGGGTVIGEFWNGDSVAAKAARRLEADGAKDAAMEMRAETNEATQELLALMCQDAYQNNASLDAWFERAGITSVDQLADIAYKNSVRTGNILKNNPQAQQALNTINSSFGNAVALGWNTAMAQSTAGTLETTQILTDKLLHEGNRITIRDKMWEAYDDQAPKMARRKLYGLLNGTDLSDESKTELKARLDSDEDIFNITADYIDLDGLQAWLHTKTNDKQKEVEDLALIGSFLGGWDKKFYTAANMVGGTASYWAKSALGTLATGNPFAGAMIAGYGGIGDTYERYSEKGATEGEAWFMALSHWLVEAKLNSGSNQSVLDDMLAGEGYTDDLFHALKNGKQNGFATALTAAKYMGVHGVKRYGQKGMEEAGEVIWDRALEMLFDVYDQENEALKNGEGMSVSRLFDTMFSTIDAVDPYEFGVEMLTNFNAGGVIGFFAGIGGSLRLTSAAFGDYRALKNYKSVQMMQQLYDGDIPGTEENIGLICQQMRLDLRDPRYRSWLDGQSKARRDLKNFGVAVSEGTAIEERSAAAELAAETKELEGRRDAAENAMTEAEAAYDDLTQRVANGEVDQVPAMEAAQTTYSRASQTYNELAEAARKKGEKAAEAAKKWMDLVLSATQEIGAEDLKQSIDRWTAQTFEIARILYEKQQADANAAEHEAWLEETFDMAHEMQDEEQAATQAQDLEDYETGQAAEEEARLAEEAELEAQVDAEAEAQAQAEQLAAEEEAVAQMTDEEIDAEIAAITENETRTAEAEAQSGEMGYDEETIAALKEQTDTQAEAKAARKQAIVLNQREQYRSLTERIEEAAQLEDADAEAELLKQRQAVQARIEALGAQIEAPEANAPEPTTDVRPAMPQAEADMKAQAQTGGENAPEPSTDTAPAKPVQKIDPRKEARDEKIADIVTGTTREQREAAKAEKQNADNISAMDVETFIEQRHKDAPEKEKATIRDLLNGIVNRTPAKITSDIYQFAARIEQKFGVKFEFVDSLDGKKRGEIEGNNIKIARDATPGELIRQTILHELTHKAEGAGKLYDALHDMILDMKYGGDQDQMNEDIKSKKRTYTDLYKKEGRTFTDTDAKQEIVADYMGEILDGNQAMIERLVRDDSTLAKRIMNTIKDAISKFAGVKDPQIKQMQKVVRLFEQALKKADKAQGGTKYLLGGANIPVEQRGQDYFDNIDLHEDIRVHNVTAITVPLGNRGRIDDKAIIVGVRKNPLVSQIGSSYVAECPDIDAKVELTDDGLMHGFHKFSESNKKNNSQPSPMALLNAKAAMHMPELLQNAVEVNRSDKYTDPKKYIGDSHVLMSVYGETDPNGNTDYYAVRMVVENRHHKHSNPLVEFGVVGKLHAGNAKKIPSANLRLPAASAANYLRSASVSTYYKVADLINDVKGTFDDTFSKGVYQNARMQRAQNDFSQHLKYSLPPQSSLEAEFRAWMQAHQVEMDEARKAYDGESQFATKTVQNARHTPEQVKKAFRENRYLNGYKKDTNADQFNRAMENIDRNGYDAEVDRLLNAETFNAEDTVEAGAIVKAAFEEEDVATAFEMALKYETIGSEQAQAMQSRKLFADMSPSHVAMRVAGDVESKLMKVMDDNPDKAKKVNSRAKEKEDALKTLDSNDKLKELNKQSSFTVSDMLDEHDRKYGVITNEQQRAAIKEYGLENVKRPGIHYNRATQKQRMLEFILMTPDLTADTGNGLTGIQRLEWMKEGVPVITAADIRYIVDRIKEYCKMTYEDKGTRLGDIALGRAFEAFRNCSPATFAERNRAYRYMNMLLTLISPARNFIGNLGQVTVNDLSDETAGAFVDWIVSGKTGERTQAHISLERRINAWHEFVAEIGNTFRDYFIDKVDTSLSMQGDNRMESTPRGRTFQNAAGNLLHNFEGFLMSFGDRTFYKREYFRSLAEQKQLADAKGVELDWEAAVDQAKADADYATFNEDNAVRDVFSYIRRKHPVADFIASLYVPFVGIPVNMVKRGFIDYTPAGAFVALVKGARDVKAGKFNQREFVQAMSRGGITGSLLVGLGILARATGFYNPGTSEDDDEKLYNLRAAQGHQYSPYIRLGEKYYNLSLIAPLIYPITIGATAYDILTDEDAEVLPSLYQAGIAAVNQLYDASFLSGVGDLFNTQDGNIIKNALSQAITNLINQHILLGAFLNQMGDLFDDYARDTKDANPLAESLKKVIARIPGAREYLLNPKYDITGEPVRGRDGVYDNLANPLSTTKANDDPALMELSRLAQSTGSTAHIPSYLIKKSGKMTILASIADEWNVDMDRSAGENKLVLDADERSRYNQLYSSLAFNGTGNTYYEGIGDMETSFTGIRETMESWEYQNANDDGKAKLISDVLSKAKLLTQAQIVIDKGYVK